MNIDLVASGIWAKHARISKESAAECGEKETGQPTQSPYGADSAAAPWIPIGVELWYTEAHKNSQKLWQN